MAKPTEDDFLIHPDHLSAKPQVWEGTFRPGDLERLTSDDPTALVGLPLAVLGSILRAEGFAIP